MNQSAILSEIYTAITTAPEILVEAPDFTKQLITKILPLADSQADNDTVEEAINQLYRQFKNIRDQIKALHRKSLDDAEPEPGYDTLTNEYPDIKDLKTELEKRIQQAEKPTSEN
jgi:predicted  nucleic acid-binding Zn-ribbon protein